MELEFQSFDGKTVHLSDFRGQAVLVNSWAAWCPFCVAEIPDLERAGQAAGDKAVVLFVHRTATESQDAGDKFLKQREGDSGLAISRSRVLLDPQDTFYKTHFGFGMPVSLFVGPDGRVVEKKVGSMDEAEARQRLERAAGVASGAGQAGARAAPAKTPVPDSEIITVLGPDSIPSIDRPKFISASEASSWLLDSEPGIAISLDGVHRFYPYQIMVWHEIVNDEIAGKPVAITYCPLCATGIAFDPVVDGKRLTLGTSGKLRNSDLIMYDRETKSLWQQAAHEAIQGLLLGKKLAAIPVDTVRFGDWKKPHPDTQVLSRDTGNPRDYGRESYPGYYTSPDVLFPVSNKDDRLHPKAIVYGVEVNGSTKAYPKDEVRKAGLANDTLGGRPLLVLHDPPLDVVRIYERPGGVEFRLDGGRVVDSAGREWTRNGSAVASGDRRLEPLAADYAFWFSWVSFRPGSEIFRA